jgi:hypothetical protein
MKYVALPVFAVAYCAALLSTRTSWRERVATVEGESIARLRAIAEGHDVDAVRIAAIERLAAKRAELVPWLCDRLAVEPRIAVRETIAESIGEAGAADPVLARSALRRACADPERAVRSAAERALQRLRSVTR